MTPDFSELIERLNNFDCGIPTCTAMHKEAATALQSKAITIAELRSTLEWYAEPVLAYAITQESEPRSAVHADGGRRARKALGIES